MIYIREANYRNRGELYLEHRFNGVELKLTYANETLANLNKLWKRPVHIETVIENQPTILSFDGAENRMSAIGKPAKQR